MLQRPGDRRLTNQVIVAVDSFDMAADAPSLDQLEESLAAIGARLPVDAAVIAGAGYVSEQKVKHASEHRLEPHIASRRFKHDEPPELEPDEPLPEVAAAKQAMARKIETGAGRAVYARRKRSSNRSSASWTPPKTPASC